jgi:hypothetical protein
MTGFCLLFLFFPLVWWAGLERHCVWIGENSWLTIIADNEFELRCTSLEFLWRLSFYLSVVIGFW